MTYELYTLLCYMFIEMFSWFTSLSLKYKENMLKNILRKFNAYSFPFCNVINNIVFVYFQIC